MAAVLLAQGAIVVVGLTWLSVLLLLVSRPDVDWMFRITSAIAWSALPILFLLFISGRENRRKAHIERLRKKSD